MTRLVVKSYFINEIIVSTCYSEISF